VTRQNPLAPDALIRVLELLDHRTGVCFEQIAMRLLSGSGVAPQLIASDLEGGVVVMSDLTPAPSVDDIIRGDDPTEATAALVALARAMGRMHALTARLGEDERAAVSSSAPQDPHVLFGHWPGVDAWADVERACSALGFPDARVARDDIAAVVAELTEPGPLLALTHTDPGPMNAVFTRADLATFVDWEGCA